MNNKCQAFQKCMLMNLHHYKSGLNKDNSLINCNNWKDILLQVNKSETKPLFSSCHQKIILNILRFCYDQEETKCHLRVPNTTVGNPYSFCGACPSYMALFGTSHLLNFVKSSFLHFYSELLAYWFFTFLSHFTINSFFIK